MKLLNSLVYPALAVVPFLAVGVANAGTVTVLGTDVIYCPGNLTCANNAGGTVPGAVINVTGVSSIQFLATGSVVLNLYSGDNSNDPDGVGAAPSSSSNTGEGLYAGITAPYAGYLVGLFTGSDTLPGTPTDYTAPGAESLASYSPTQNQAFFIGDGLTGDGTGAEQTFYVPTGATTLYLGISDAGGYNGGPSSYGDNSGSFSVTYTAVGSGLSTTPEPSSLVLLGTGLASVAAAARRKFRK